MNAIEKDVYETIMAKDNLAIGRPMVDKDFTAISKDVASKFERFEIWKSFEDHPFFIDSVNKDWYNTEDNKHYTLPELYQYWLDNVDGK